MVKIKFNVAIAFSQAEVYPANYVHEFDVIPEHFKPFIDNGTLSLLDSIEKPKHHKVTEKKEKTL